MHKVVKIPVRTFTGTLDKVLAYSSDQQPADIVISVTFSIHENSVDKLYGQFKDIDSAYQAVITPLIKEEVKTIFGQYTALRSIQKKRTSKF